MEPTLLGHLPYLYEIQTSPMWTFIMLASSLKVILFVNPTSLMNANHCCNKKRVSSYIKQNICFRLGCRKPSDLVNSQSYILLHLSFLSSPETLPDNLQSFIHLRTTHRPTHLLFVSKAKLSRMSLVLSIRRR